MIATMAVHVKCNRPYNIEALKAIIANCGGRGPSPPRCPPMDQTFNSSYSHLDADISSSGPCRRSASSAPSLPSSVSDPCSSPRKARATAQRSGTTSSGTCGMTCPPMAPIPPCPPCPFICPPCTGYPCVTLAPFPKPVPAPCEPARPVVRTPINAGGLFYTGTTVCYPCLPPASPPKYLPCIPISGMSVWC